MECNCVIVQTKRIIYTHQQNLLCLNFYTVRWSATNSDKVHFGSTKL
ncbi:hypothetical protein TcasGA2_TC034563 [Tribolium castaneum]|uniref:Uncharacterized protein n=1 Tax=Tribolium castaneum TaxID=7070 RepID=A0A139WNH3_TRICA|nr:hypothetical protein TcasGA2_TC034563 [Tribolium castaneum]